MTKRIYENDITGTISNFEAVHRIQGRAERANKEMQGVNKRKRVSLKNMDFQPSIKKSS